MNSRMFESQRVVVTGAAHNTGFHIVRSFLREGARVMLVDFAAEDLRAAADKLHDEFGGAVLAECCDIAAPDQIACLFQVVARQMGSLEVLVNNAAQQGVGYSFADTPLETLNDVFSVNIRGTFLCSQQAARLMIPARRGAIINLTSNISMRPIYNRSAYTTSKGAIDALTRASAIELAPYGIRVNAVAPGYLRSARWDHLGQQKIDRRRRNIPSHRETWPEHVAEAVLYLASTKADSVVGTILPVDGGCSVQHMPSDVDV